MNENEIAKIIVNIRSNGHKQYGPGLFENVYEEIVCYELSKTGLIFSKQKGIKVIHEGVDMGIGFIPDIIVENKIIIELKSVEKLADIHFKQILTYLRLTNIKIGLLINFNVPLIKDGIKRIANNI